MVNANNSQPYHFHLQVVGFTEKLYPTGNVEDWLLEVERVMKSSLHDILFRALEAYPETERTEWVLQWPGQIVIAGRLLPLAPHLYSHSTVFCPYMPTICQHQKRTRRPYR